MNQRRWFQIHLSTALILMILVPVIVWLNLQPDRHAIDGPAKDYGWPWLCYGEYGNESIYSAAGIVKNLVFIGAVLSGVILVSEKYLKTGKSQLVAVILLATTSGAVFFVWDTGSAWIAAPFTALGVAGIFTLYSFGDEAKESE